MKLIAALASAGLLVALTGCPNKSRNESIKASNDGHKASGQKQWDTAIERYDNAIKRWADNNSALYGLAVAHAQKRDWSKAAEAAGRAVELVPGEAMYQLMYGRMLYEKAIHQAREDQARRDGKKVEDVQADLTVVNFEKPQQHLEQAVKLNNELWRAHYYLGRIYRDTGKWKEAAAEFTKALEGAPPEPAPWIAAAELYRHWDYTDQAIQVAEQGTLVVLGSHEVSDIWFEVGMGYDDKRNDDKAIAAFDKALEAKRDNHKAKFARGQAYFRKGDFANAKRDLEEFGKSGGASVEFFKQQASRMLMEIAAKSATPVPERVSPEELVKKTPKKKGK